MIQQGIVYRLLSLGIIQKQGYLVSDRFCAGEILVMKNHKWTPSARLNINIFGNIRLTSWGSFSKKLTKLKGVLTEQRVNYYSRHKLFSCIIKFVLRCQSKSSWKYSVGKSYLPWSIHWSLVPIGRIWSVFFSIEIPALRIIWSESICGYALKRKRCCDRVSLCCQKDGKK